MNSPRLTGRALLSVIGPHSGCGKTLFVTHLLRRMPGLGCLKVRPAHQHPGSDVDEPPSEREFYLEDTRATDDSRSDTALYLAAGAVRVEILRHRGSGLSAGLDLALEQFPPGIPVVVESSSAVRFLSPTAIVLIVHPPPREMKPSTAAILSRVTDLLINAAGPGGLGHEWGERLLREYPALRPLHVWSADLASEPPPPEMLTRLRGLLTSESAD